MEDRILSALHEELIELVLNGRTTLEVLNAAWNVSIPLASENALPCYDREGYNKILQNAKPLNDLDGRHFSAFTYLRLSPMFMEKDNFVEFGKFVNRMQGEAVSDLQDNPNRRDTKLEGTDTNLGGGEKVETIFRHLTIL